jgi:di/tricarboxylate transporter
MLEPIPGAAIGLIAVTLVTVLSEWGFYSPAELAKPGFMWTAIAATCVTSSMFLTALAPNLLALELIRKTANVELSWMQWFLAFAPAGVVLLLAVPLLAYVLYPPQVKEGSEVPAWAAKEL